MVYDESTLLVDVPILFFTEKEFFSNKNIGFRTDNGHSKELSSFVLWTRLLLLLYTAKVATTAIADSTSCKKFFSDTFVCRVGMLKFVVRRRCFPPKCCDIRLLSTLQFNRFDEERAGSRDRGRVRTHQSRKYPNFSLLHFATLKLHSFAKSCWLSHHESHQHRQEET